MRSTSYTHFGTAACCWDFLGAAKEGYAIRLVKCECGSLCLCKTLLCAKLCKFDVRFVWQEHRLLCMCQCLWMVGALRVGGGSVVVPSPHTEKTSANILLCKFLGQQTKCMANRATWKTQHTHGQKQTKVVRKKPNICFQPFSSSATPSL